MPRNGDTGLTATRGRTVPPCRKGPSSHTGRMPTPRLPHPLARRRLTWLRPGKPKPAAPWASAPAAPAAGTGAGPSPVQSHGQHSADAQLGPSRLLRQGPQAQEKGQPFGPATPQQGVLSRCQPQGAGAAQSAGLAQQQALFRLSGRMQHAHRAPRLPAPEMEVRRSGEIFQPGRKMPRHRDSLPCRGQGAEQQRGVFRLRHPALPDHAPCPASFWTISCPMTKA